MTLFILTALTALLLSSLPAQAQKKAVDAAMRLVGKTDGLAEARRLIKEAMQHPQTQGDARTWYVAGLIEWRSYQADVRKREINPKDESVKDAAMTAKMLDGYRYFLKALPLDSLPDRKGRVRPRFSSRINELLDQNIYELYRAGALSYNAGRLYPDAYTGFMAAARVPQPMEGTAVRALSDSARADALFYAGLSAYGADRPRQALHAFRMAERAGMRTDTLLLYQLAIWERLGRDSVSLHEEVRDSLLSVARRGVERHGVRTAEFLSREVQIEISEGRGAQAALMLDSLIARYPESWLPRALRGWAYESIGRDADAVADYKLAAESPDISYKMLMRGAHMLYRSANAQRLAVRGTAAERRKEYARLRKEYYEPSLNMARRAAESATDPRDITLIENIIEAIDYNLALIK